MRSSAKRIDTDLLRQQHPIVDVIAHYGIELRRSGSAFTGRCPFHVDRGRPNLAAYPLAVRAGLAFWTNRAASGCRVESLSPKFARGSPSGLSAAYWITATMPTSTGDCPVPSRSSAGKKLVVTRAP